ncbi:cupin domain-containing protein [Halohasta litorea]|uniref:Cupin domain-containing protein n=1 Tax=Halohasta litorea TaxID=869891 RepID=A0ABD6D8A9_9EURY|nr:cupin domain-containing protein [Halohasta litorea]
MSQPSEITVVDGDALSPIDTPVAGLTAHCALSTGQATVGRCSVDAASSADWYRHPDREAYGFVHDGPLELRYRSTDGSTESIEAGETDCVRVPAGVDHQLAALDGGPAVVLIALVGSGPLFEAVDEPESTTTAPQIASRDAFVETAQLANLTRLTPFPDAPVQQVVGHADGEMASEWHHHGDNDVFGHLIAGEGYVDDGSAEPPVATAGSWFHIPAGVVHRDVNPQDAPQEYVLWLTGSEPRLVSVEGPS